MNPKKWTAQNGSFFGKHNVERFLPGEGSKYLRLCLENGHKDNGISNEKNYSDKSIAHLSLGLILLPRGSSKMVYPAWLVMQMLVLGTAAANLPLNDWPEASSAAESLLNTFSLSQLINITIGNSVAGFTQSPYIDGQPPYFH